MSLSEFYDDESIVNSLRLYFAGENEWDIDFEGALSKVTDYDEDNYSLIVKGKTFLIDKINATVIEVE